MTAPAKETRLIVDRNVSVVVRFSAGPAYYHLLEVHDQGKSAVVQISAECSRETVAALAAAVRGLGAI
jgi:hypothetical protein